MDVMMIFELVMMGIGIYMLIAAFNMKKKNEIGTVILAEEEVLRCSDKTGFITYIYWREAVLGSALILYGVVGLLEQYVFQVGRVLDFVCIVILLVIFGWFYNGLQNARKKFLY